MREREREREREIKFMCKRSVIFISYTPHVTLIKFLRWQIKRHQHFLIKEEGKLLNKAKLSTCHSKSIRTLGHRER